MLNWARSLLGSAAGAISAGVRDLINLAVTGLAAVIDTVFGNVTGAWRDLQRAVTDGEKDVAAYVSTTYRHLARIISHDIPVWAQTGWFWVTHPQRLARSLFWYLVRLAEDNAFTMARYLGGFALSLAWHHSRELLITAEDIIDAVL